MHEGEEIEEDAMTVEEEEFAWEGDENILLPTFWALVAKYRDAGIRSGCDCSQDRCDEFLSTVKAAEDTGKGIAGIFEAIAARMEAVASDASTTDSLAEMLRRNAPKLAKAVRSNSPQEEKL